MKINYDKTNDSLYISLSDNKAADTREIVSGLNIDLDENNQICGIDIDHAKRFVDLAKLEMENMPFSDTKIS